MHDGSNVALMNVNDNMEIVVDFLKKNYFLLLVVICLAYLFPHLVSLSQNIDPLFSSFWFLPRNSEVPESRGPFWVCRPRNSRVPRSLFWFDLRTPKSRSPEVPCCSDLGTPESRSPEILGLLTLELRSPGVPRWFCFRFCQPRNPRTPESRGRVYGFRTEGFWEAIYKRG